MVEISLLEICEGLAGSATGSYEVHNLFMEAHEDRGDKVSVTRNA